MRARKILALLIIAFIVLAAFVPAGAMPATTVLVPLWLGLFPLIEIRRIRRRVVASDEQPVALLSLLASRAPPLA